MATDLIMPTLNTQQSNYFLPERPQHHRSQSYQPGPRPGVSYNGISSLSSSNSSANSPTSPKPYMPRQRPLFIPAALRPNEFPSRPVPVPKPSLSEDSTPVSSLTRSGTGLLSLAGSALQTLTRRSTGDSGKVIDDKDDEDELDPELFPDVKALPKRTHWKVPNISTGGNPPRPLPETETRKANLSSPTPPPASATTRPASAPLATSPAATTAAAAATSSATSTPRPSSRSTRTRITTRAARPRARVTTATPSSSRGSRARAAGRRRPLPRPRSRTCQTSRAPWVSGSRLGRA